jgi:exosome complex RNA-binding protein Csl4
MSEPVQQVNTRETVFRCASCGKPLMVGELVKGSKVTAKCHNRKCASPFKIIIAAS